MGNLFGRAKKSRVTEQDKAVLQLKQQRDKLKQYQKKIQNVMEKDREVARTLLRDGKKDRARLLLKKKRYQEQLLEKTEGQLDNIERLVHDLEFAQVEMQVVDNLKVGNEALKKVHALFSIEDVEKIMEETAEGVEKQKEIDALLSGALTSEDEAAVEEELADIIAASLPQTEEELPELPAVPEEEPERVKDEEKAKERQSEPKQRVALEAA